MIRARKVLSPTRPGRPSKFDARMGRELVRLAATGDHPNRLAIARAAGIGVRTLHEWLAAGRVGRAPFAGWVEAFEVAESEAQCARRAERSERKAARDRARWERFRASRE